MLVAQSLLGVVLIPLLAWGVGENRHQLSGRQALKIAAGGLAAQFSIAGVLLLVPQAQLLFALIGALVHALQEATLEGMRFVFGYLAGGPAPFAITEANNGFILAFHALPLILLMSVLSRVLYYWGILPRVVQAIAWVLQRTLGVSGPLGIAAAAKVFLGMVEAPLLIRPYLAGLSRGELFTLMTIGMSTVAGTVFALYAAILEPVVPGAAGHVLVASLINVPAAILLTRLMMPQASGSGGPAASLVLDDGPASTMEAIAQGTIDGLRLLASVVAMLVVMVALVALANALLGAAARPFGLALTFQKILGVAAAPLAFLIGIPAAEAGQAGALIGLKVILNELLAYLELARLPEAALSPRSRLILTYALCGFANFGSLGILVGGLSAMVPERRREIAELGLRSMLTGVLATLLSGAVVGTLIWK